MRAAYALLLSGLMVGAAVPAFAADPSWQACIGSDDQAAIRGCGEVIARGSAETPRNLALAYYNRAVSYQNLKAYARALADSEEALRIRPGYAQAFTSRGNARAALGQFDGALADFNEAIRGDGRNGQLYLNRGQVYAKKGLVDQARADFRFALQLRPQLAEAQQALSGLDAAGQPGTESSVDPAFLDCMGQDDRKAVTGCTLFLTQNPSASPEIRASALYNRGISYRGLGDNRRALVDFDAAIALKADYANPWSARATVKADGGDLSGAVADYDHAIALQPGSPQFRRNRGVALPKAGQRERAKLDFDQAIALDPKDPQLLVSRAGYFEKIGDSTQAAADYQRALTLSPALAEASTGLARLGKANTVVAADNTPPAPTSEPNDADWTACASADPATSVAGCDKVLARGDSENAANRALAYLNRGLSHRLQTKYAAAIEDFGASLAVQPDMPAALRSRADTLLVSERYDEASRDYDKVISLDAKDASAYVARSQARLFSHDYDGAIADTRAAVAIDPKRADAPYWLGQVFLARNDLDKAYKAFDDAIALAGDQADFYASRGRVELYRGELETARADFDKALSLDGKSLVALDGVSQTARFSGRIDESIAAVTQAIAASPQNSTLYNGRAELLIEAGRQDEAAPDLDKAIDLDTATLARPGVLSGARFDALADRAYARALKGDLDAAVADATEALTIDPQSKEVLDSRGFARMLKGDYGRAISDFSQSVAFGGFVLPIYMHRAKAYEGSKQLDLAGEDYKAALALAPAFPPAQAGLARIEQALNAASQVAAKDPVVPPAEFGRRVALIIGNGAYSKVGQLPNPKRDAEAVASTLREIGFVKVTVAEDLTEQGFNDALRQFAEDADGADWAVVYYAGHGVEIDNTNYLVPVDAKLVSDRDVQFEAVPLEKVVTAVEGAKGMRLVILDACRDNPFLAQMKRTVATRAVTRGLARVEPDKGTLIVYSAKAGEVALDGQDGNSPFVTALTNRIRSPGLEIGKLFRLVRDDVLSATGDKQEPFTYGSLPGADMFINPTK